MCLFKWMEKVAKKFKWYDFSILKITMVAIGIGAAILIPELLQVQWWIYAIVAGTGALYLWAKMIWGK